MSALQWQQLRDRLRDVMPVGPEGLATWVGEATVAILMPLKDWLPLLQDAETLVDDAERARADRQRNPRHRDALVVTYALHRLLLSMAMRCPPDRTGIARDALGRPRLPGDILHTSLGHCEDCIVIAIAASGPVGIDAEPVHRIQGMDDIVERVAHVDEREWLQRLSMEERRRALLDLWVRKEALLKAAGIGLECPMEDFPLPADVPVPLPAGPGIGHMLVVKMLDIDPRWSVAVACPPDANVRSMVI